MTQHLPLLKRELLEGEKKTFAMSGPVEEQDSEYEWNVGFGDTNYVVNLAVKGAMISLEIEETVSNERWSGEFTAQYMEEITLKAGNFKKFSVFVKMLISSFDRENDSVYVDVLTYADLETLKARKAGTADGANAGAATTASTTGKSKSEMKRYVILTYRSDYDRVHYPLPLSFEETPNTESMRRTIRRLREVVDARSKEGRPAEFMGEKDLRAMVANLRQENQELRHRMRQAESRSAKAASNNAGLGANISHGDLSKVNSELMAQNSKLKRQVEACKRDLAAADVNFEKMRTDAAKDISKWKMKALEGDPGGAGASVGSNSSADRLEKYGSASNSDAAALRHRIRELERELKLERMSSAQARRSGSAYKRPSSTYSPGGSHNRSATPPPSRSTGVWSPASGSAPPRQSSRSPASSAYQARHARTDPYNDPQAKENRLKAAAAAARIRERTSRMNSAGSASGSARGSKDSTSGVHSRDTTPINNRRSGSAQSRDSRGRSVSPALPSSSTGGRFDPTAYQRAKEQRMAQNLSDRNSFRNSVGINSPGSRSGSNSRRDSYSGYDSADSRGSRGLGRRGEPSLSVDRSRKSPVAAVGRKGSPSAGPRDNAPQPPARKANRRKQRGGGGRRDGSSSGDGKGGEASRGILSGSDSEDEHLRMRAASATASAARNNNNARAAEGGKGIAEAIYDVKEKESVVSKVVGAFPFPMAGGSDGEADAEPPLPMPSPPKRSSTGPNVHSPKIVKSGSSGSKGCPKKAPASPAKERDDSMEQVLPATSISFDHINSTGYGSLNGFADSSSTSKSPRQSQDSKSPVRSPGKGKSPVASPSRASPRSSREGLSVSFSEFRGKTPSSSEKGEDEIGEIDKRIQALQSYLDNARTGLLAVSSPK